MFKRLGSTQKKEVFKDLNLSRFESKKVARPKCDLQHLLTPCAPPKKPGRKQPMNVQNVKSMVRVVTLTVFTGPREHLGISNTFLPDNRHVKILLIETRALMLRVLAGNILQHELSACRQAPQTTFRWRRGVKTTRKTKAAAHTHNCSVSLGALLCIACGAFS